MSKGVILEAGFRNLAKAVDRTAVKDTKLMEAAIRRSGIAPKVLKELPKDTYAAKAIETKSINKSLSLKNYVLEALRGIAPKTSKL